MFALDMSEYDKKIWQAEQAARDALQDKQREKWAKAKARSARNAQRKLERLKRKLSESGDLSDWEEEFSESVTERLEKFGSAFQDPEKGRPADALSFAQKKVVSALNKKAKDLKAKGKEMPEDEAEDKKPAARKSFKKKGGFKNKKNYTPRVRQLEEDFEAAEAPPSKDEPFIPELTPDNHKPFLRLIK